ncbi:MAG TPA: hypothetical protein V6C98_10245 [Thermosynechococcaceae cyanobacterium]
MALLSLEPRLHSNPPHLGYSQNITMAKEQKGNKENKKQKKESDGTKKQKKDPKRHDG